MNLTLTREQLGSESTEGILFVDGEQECFTLELPVKDGKPGSAIPPGQYLIIIAGSPKFLRSTDTWVQRFAYTIPHVVGIPGRSEILIHWGNDAADTEGCILVGQTRGDNFVGSSRAAFEALHDKLIAARSRGEAISIEVQGGIPQAQPIETLDLEE
ncbi:MAG TPA: DUF5675 family protein [Candidatus Acidoferrum sp.]